MTASAFVAIGSNLGDRAAYLAAARAGLARIDGVQVVRVTDVEETAPLGGLDQPAYLNQMVRLETSLEARVLLSACHALEREAGRARHVHWGSRTLDVDLVRYGTMLCDRPDLRLPHPGLRDRPFWQRELAALESDG